MFERSEFAPAAKIRVDEGSLRSKPATGVAFLLLTLLAVGALRVSEAKKSKWPRGHEAQSKTIRNEYKNTFYF